ncbi:MAG: aldose 1-epimerase, partial [Ignavibacterium sp.]
MFEVKEEKNNGLLCTIIKNNATGEYVSIVPEFGANVNDLVLKKGEELISILDGNQNKYQFTGKNIFKGAKLFPFVNRIKNGSYYFDDKRYQLDINYPEEGNAAHGIVYNIQFVSANRIIDRSCAKALFKLEYDGSISGFPFAFDLELIYMLDIIQGFSCETIVTNTSLNNFPFSDGW